MSKPEIDEITLKQVERLKAVLIQLQGFTVEVISSGPINSSVVIPPRTKSYVTGGPAIFIPSEIREAFEGCNIKLELLITDLEATIKEIRRKDKRARKRLNERYKVEGK